MEGYQFFLAGLAGKHPFMMTKGNCIPRVTLAENKEVCQSKFLTWDIETISWAEYFYMYLNRKEY